jgi:hypothetical protein
MLAEKEAGMGWAGLARCFREGMVATVKAGGMSQSAGQAIRHRREHGG